MLEQGRTAPEQQERRIERQIRNFKTSDEFSRFEMNTQLLYDQDLRRFQRFLAQQKLGSLTEINQEVISSFLRANNHSTAQRAYAAIKNFMRWAEDTEIILPRQNPFISVSKGQKASFINGTLEN